MGVQLHPLGFTFGPKGVHIFRFVSISTTFAIKALKTLCFQGFFFCSGSIYFGENNSNGALGAPLCGARLIPHHTHYTRKMYAAVPQWCPELLKSYEK